MFILRGKKKPFYPLERHNLNINEQYFFVSQFNEVLKDNQLIIGIRI